MSSHRFTKRWLLQLAVFALLSGGLATACGGTSSGQGPSGKESASDFIKRVTTEFSRGQAGRLWDELYAPDQAIVSRARYMQCQGNQGFHLKGIKVLETYPEAVDISGAPEKSEAVSVQVSSDNGITTATVHAVRVGASWRWILSAADRAAYRSGKCP